MEDDIKLVLSNLAHTFKNYGIVDLNNKTVSELLDLYNVEIYNIDVEKFKNKYFKIENSYSTEYRHIIDIQYIKNKAVMNDYIFELKYESIILKKTVEFSSDRCGIKIEEKGSYWISVKDIDEFEPISKDLYDSMMEYIKNIESSISNMNEKEIYREYRLKKLDLKN